MLRKLTMLTAVLALSACASANGPSYQPVKAYDGQAKVVVYRGADVKLGTAPVSLNGRLACDLPSSGYFVIDAKPNTPLSLTIRAGIDPRTSHFDFTPKSGQTYYVSVETNPTGIIGSALLGLGGNIAAQREADMVMRDGNPADAIKTREACNG